MYKVRGFADTIAALQQIPVGAVASEWEDR